MRVLQRNKSLLFVVLFTVSLFFSCSRETTTPGNSLPFDATLRSWLSVNGKNYSTGQISIRDNGTVRTGSLNWNKVTHFVSGAAEFYELPFSFAQNNTMGATRVPDFTMVFQRSSDGTILARIKSEFVNDPKITSENQTNDFVSGSMFDDLDGTRKAMYILKAGGELPVRVYKKPQTNAVQQSNTPQIKTSLTEDCVSYAHMNYSYECVGASSEIPGDYNVSCGYLAVGVEMLSFCGSPGILPQDNFNYAGYNGGAGGGSSSGASIDKITDSLKNACLEYTWNLVNSNDFNNEIINLLNNTFGASDKFNITIVETPNLVDTNGNSLDGHTKARPDPNTGVMNIRLQLNLTTLPGATQEYTAATIFHEIIHAYLSTIPDQAIKLNQENVIALSYVTCIISALKKDFPNLTDDEAEALAWGGLDGTSVWNNYLTNAQQSAYGIENNRQHAGNNGTKCH